MSKLIINLFRFLFGLMVFCTLVGCTFVSNKKFLDFENGNYRSKIIIIDNNKRVSEYNIEPGWVHGWSEDIIGDFKLVFIETEDNLEGLFIINNEYKKKFPYGIISLNELGKRLTEEYENNINISSPYNIIIRIVDNAFEIEYDNTKYSINSFYNSDQEYIKYKGKYMEEYN